MEREQSKNGNYVCLCCGYATLGEVNAYEICEICYWEDDGQDDQQAEENWDGPNHLSLTQARVNFLTVGASDTKDSPYTRAPKPVDENVRNYKLVNGKVIAN